MDNEDLIHIRSKRRCTLYPGKPIKLEKPVKKTSKGKTAGNKPKPIEVRKHFESKSKVVPYNQQELPFHDIKEEDEDFDVISANIQFYPTRHHGAKTTTAINQPIKETISSSSAHPTEFAPPNQIKTPEKYKSVKSNPPCKLNKNQKLCTAKTTTKRSSSLASSQSSSISEDPCKKSKPLGSKSVKRPPKKHENDNLENLRENVNRLTTELNAVENKLHVNLTKKHKLIEKNEYTVDQTSSQPGFSIITESYIQNLKDEITSSRFKSPEEIDKTADRLRAEINQFRNANIHSNSTNVKITYPKFKIPNTLDLKITNSIHKGSYVVTQTDPQQEECIGCNNFRPLLSAINEKGTNMPSNFELEQCIKQIQRDEEVSEDSDQLFKVPSHCRTNIQNENVLRTIESEGTINCDLVFPIPDELDEKEILVSTLDTFSISADLPMPYECPGKVSDNVEDSSKAVAVYQEANGTGQCGEKPIGPEDDSPRLPIIMNVVQASMSVQTSTSRGGENLACPEEPQEVSSHPNVDDHLYYVKLLREQNEHVRELCNILFSLTNKINQSKCNEIPECQINDQQSEEHSNNSEVLQIDNEENVSIRGEELGSIKGNEIGSNKRDELGRVDVCIQVDWDNFGEKQSLISDISDENELNDSNLNEVNVSIDSDTLPTITEGSEKSSTTEEPYATVFPKHEVDIPSRCTKTQCPIHASASGTNHKNVKSLKSIKDTVMIRSVISQTIKKGVEEKQQDAVALSLQSKLSIQLMPAIDIRRGLVTQTIPAIVINPSESIPQNVQQDSNVAYEIMKHSCDEIINVPKISNKNQGEVAPPGAVGYCDNKKSDKDVHTKKNNRSEFPTMIEIQSETSCVSMIHTDRLEKMYPILPPKEECVTCSRKTMWVPIEVEVPVTTFMNEHFRPESASDDNSTTNNDSPRKTGSSTEYRGKTEYVTKFIKKMIRNPDTEVILKSYQVVQEQAEHDPQQELDHEKLSNIDTDVYKTYVNPRGLKNNTETCTHKKKRVCKKKVADKYLLLPVTIPTEFYSTKATQCEEHAPVKHCILKEPERQEPERQEPERQEPEWQEPERQEPERQEPEERETDKDETYEDPEDKYLQDVQPADEDDGFGSDNVWRPSTLHFDVVSPPPKGGLNFDPSTIEEDPNYIPKRNSYELPFDQYSRSSRSSTRQSRGEIPLDVKKHLFSARRISAQRPRHSISDLSITDGDSISTENVILEITRDKLRSKAQYPSGENARQQSESGSTSDYVITRDISLQTSLAGSLSDEALQLRRLSNNKLQNSVAKLKSIVEEDTRSVIEPIKNISCCGRAPKQTVSQESYYRSSDLEAGKIDFDNISLTSEHNSTRMEMPEAVPLYKPPPQTLNFFRKASRKFNDAPASFTQQLTNKNLSERVVPKAQPYIPPRNEFMVLEMADNVVDDNELTVLDIAVSAGSDISFTSQDWKSPIQMPYDSPSSTNMNIHISELGLDKGLNEDENVRARVAQHLMNTSTSSLSNDVDVYTIMPVNVSHPEDIQIQEKLPIINKDTVKKPQRNDPGGDDAASRDSRELHTLYSARIRHEGIFPRQHRRKINSDSSSSAASTLESGTEKTDGNLSEGEVKCPCSASIGEIHVCPYTKQLKKNPKRLLQREFGNPNIKIDWQKKFNSNWVAYYVSRSPSPDNSSTDSSGIVRK